jgi:drug/metabolite transporter (DMT)-like permease
MVLAALQPSLPIREAEGHVVSNPIGVAAVENPDQSGAGAALLGLLLLLLGVALVSLVIRFRRSRGDERQQLKWFTYAGALLVLPLEDFVPAAAPSDAIFGLVVACLPIAAGSRFCVIGYTTSTG